MITIGGQANSRDASGSMPVAGAMVGAYRNDDPNTPVVMTTTDASGNYSLTVSTDGKPLDGFIKATATGLLDSYLYPPAPIVADYANASLNMISSDTLGLLSGVLCGSEQEATNGVVAVLVRDDAEMAVAGATVSASPNGMKTCYNEGGLPNRNATMTDTDGIAYFLNLPAGEVTVSAAKSGLTFVSHKVNARAGVLTTTPIEP